MFIISRRFPHFASALEENNKNEIYLIDLSDVYLTGDEKEQVLNEQIFSQGFAALNSKIYSVF